MIASGTDILFKEYLDKFDERWAFANSILYQMCEQFPEHNDCHVVVAKTWLIGRSYAAAIERRKNAETSNEDFYYDRVAPAILSICSELDSRLSCIRQSDEAVKNRIGDTLGVHKYLMNVYYELTGMEKRSLASKYLHFHCPNHFFIYDSRASAAIRKLVRKPDKSCLMNLKQFDPLYADYVIRMIELQEYIEQRTGTLETPRVLDSFLLNMSI